MEVHLEGHLALILERGTGWSPVKYVVEYVIEDADEISVDLLYLFI